MAPPVLDRLIPRPPVTDTRVDAERLARRSASIYFFILVATLVLTPLLILVGVDQGFSQVLAGLVALVALVLVPHRPILGLYTIVICAVLIEQEPLTGTPIGTDHLYIFYWPLRLQGLPDRPIGFFMLAMLLLIVMTRLVHHQ